MNLLIREAVILDSSQPKYHKKKHDLLIQSGIIKKISDSIEKPEDCEIYQHPNLHISKGWFDSSVSFGEPGFEERETLANGLETAARSGFTAVALNTNTFPVIDNASVLSFIQNVSKNIGARLFPKGALTEKSEGKRLAALHEMYEQGAVAFSDYKKSTENANLFKTALLYCRDFDGLACSFPLNKSLAAGGYVNEHENATRLGLPGIGNIAESVRVKRDLSLLDYTKGRLHFSSISTAESVALIGEAKEKGLDVSCAVSMHQLFFTDDNLSDFDTNFKVLPPLRTENDRQALINGLKEGIVDMACSDHNPLNTELKQLEFQAAAYGTIGLESAYAALNKLLGTETAVDILTRGRSRFRIEEPQLSEGAVANISLFNPEPETIFSDGDIHSFSKNSAFLGATLKGRVLGVVNRTKMKIYDYQTR